MLIEELIGKSAEKLLLELVDKRYSSEQEKTDVKKKNVIKKTEKKLKAKKAKATKKVRKAQKKQSKEERESKQAKKALTSRKTEKGKVTKDLEKASNEVQTKKG